MSKEEFGARKILEHLKHMGIGGQQIVNIAANELHSSATPQQFTDTLRALEGKGYIQVYGHRTLDDLAALVDEKSAQLLSLEEQEKQCLVKGSNGCAMTGKTNHYRLFQEDSKGSYNGDDGHDFFATYARITLKGRFALATGKALPDQPPAIDLPAARKNLDEKRRAETQAEQNAKGAKDFDRVIGIMVTSQYHDNEGGKKDWEYESEYWDKDRWAVFNAHNRLLGSSPEYKSAFETAVNAGKKREEAMMKSEDHLVEGSASSRVVENPYLRFALAVAFYNAAHPFSTIKESKSRKTMRALHEADRNAGANPNPSAP